MPFSTLVQSKKCKYNTLRTLFFCIVLYVPFVDVYEQQNKFTVTIYLSDYYQTIYLMCSYMKPYT